VGSVSRAELSRQEEAVLSACLKQVLSRPISEVTIKSVAEAADLSLWAAHRAAGRAARNRGHLIRRAVMRLGAEVEAMIRSGPQSTPTIYATVEACVAHMAEVMATPAFGGLFRLVVCEGRCHRWLHDLYEERVGAAFVDELEEAARAAGQRSRTAVCFLPGAQREALRQLETRFALPLLMPASVPPAGDRHAVIRIIAREAFSRSYAWELGAAA
jgi:hypothetical protein